MCLRKLFPNWFPPDPIPEPIPDPEPTTVKRIHLGFAINDWPGSSNDLRGCLYDLQNIIAFLKKNYPDYVSYVFTDSEVTRKRIKDECRKHILTLTPEDRLKITYSGHGTYGTDPHGIEADGYIEALYPYDGPLWDYELKEILDLAPAGTVELQLDSCFSAGAATRSIGLVHNNLNIRNRYMPYQKINPCIPIRKSILRGEDINYLIFAGCQERQTSADAYIDGQYQGAFTYFWIKEWERNLTNQQWMDKVNLGIANGYEQIPTLIGKDISKNKIVFT